ncbi:putative serine protease [hydrothermal vent metagenome]|uniref:Putative serine protease n=1 Tax=hydrothermal vent metagenome TaxID=652676 RepID=A0A3B0Z1L8_9ZZZZ
MTDRKDAKPHFFLGRTGKPELYTSVSTGGGKKQSTPEQNRQQHGSALLSQLQQIQTDQQTLKSEASAYPLESAIGIQIEFESFPDIALAVESLANETHKIELLNVIHRKNTTFATIFVPEGKLSAFEKKLRDYLSEKKNKNGGAIDNRPLIDAIRSFRVAALEALWTDDLDQLPDDTEQNFWWEVWLPVRGNRQGVIHDFTLLANTIGIEVSPQSLRFPENSVLLAKGNRRQFSQTSLLLNNISELRRAKETAAFFDEMPVDQQHEWTGELLNRVLFSGITDSTPYVCILDTGVNRDHPLLSPVIGREDQFSLDENWTGADDNGHGTGSAGLIAWGDLTSVLEDDSVIEIDHRLESVKTLRHHGDNEDKHLGIVTADSISLPEIEYPFRTRVFSMALSATDARDRGRPSAWSAAIDSLSADYLGENEKPRLIVLAAGNSCSNPIEISDYPDYNIVRDIHDPGQAWNAITVGAYTDKVTVTEEDSSDYTALAPFGGLSPFSTTSTTWEPSTPIKPEIVFEGGNVGVNQHGCLSFPSLDLLTTHHQLTTRLFSTFHATSAATALASRFAAEIYVQYPKLWPETVRALMVHSAQWTDAMCEQFAHGNTPRQKAQDRVRCVGFGVPNLDRALWSANNSLALVIEDQLQPFDKIKGKVATRDMHLHDLPWPKESLLELGETNVEMTVTLSYFIEPNPSSRGVKGKYSYPSYNLKFDVKRATESLDDFRKRINRQARDEEEGTSSKTTDPDWLLGSQFRHKGSIHKDVWSGTAADLAERGKIAIYPAIGWWKTRAKLERYNKSVRYALIVSISVPDVKIDIYNEVFNLLEIEQFVEV